MIFQWLTTSQLVFNVKALKKVVLIFIQQARSKEALIFCIQQSKEITFVNWSKKICRRKARDIALSKELTMMKIISMEKIYQKSNNWLMVWKKLLNFLNLKIILYYEKQ